MMRCIPCTVGSKDKEHPDCEAKHGAITPCECLVCFPPGSATQAPGESASAYAARLLREHGFSDRGYEKAVQMALESAEPPPRETKFEDVKDAQGRI